MILQALTQHYEALAQKGTLERPGWQTAKVSFALRLAPDGELRGVVDVRQEEERGKKKVLVPKSMNVPAQVKRSSGVAANLLCDNAAYMLGVDSKGKPERAKSCFEACAQAHHQMLDGVDHPAARAILAFFDTWNPATACENEHVLPVLDDLASANIVFQVGMDYAQEILEIRDAWQIRYDAPSSDALKMRCLVTGAHTEIERLHPSIKGVKDAQSMGASLVSFNAPAFESYGRDGEQGLNAPVGKYAAFAYGAALNHLLSDRQHMLYLGDMTVVFWAEEANENEADFLTALLEGNEVRNQEIADALRKLANGLNADWADMPVKPDNHFWILGLAPNAARLSVRFFMSDTFGALARRMIRHHKEMEIARPAYDTRETLSLWGLLNETVNPHASDKKASPQMAGDVLRAILTGARYPETLYQQVQLRIRAEREITRGRAAIIKAYLLRNVQTNQAIISEVAQVKLNEETTYAPYVLGRLFAVLEGLQEAANPGINATIKDRYFSSACCMPAMTFPTLINLAQAHLKKLDKGGNVYFSKQIGELAQKMDEPYPARLNLADQGVFQLGYYHQTQKRFEKKEDKNNG